MRLVWCGSRVLGVAGIVACVLGVCGFFRTAAGVMLIGNLYALAVNK
jgi:hypothetical protein